MIGYTVVVWVLASHEVQGEGKRRGLFSFQCTPSGPADNVSFLTFELALCVRERGGRDIAIRAFPENLNTPQ